MLHCQAYMEVKVDVAIGTLKARSPCARAVPRVALKGFHAAQRIACRVSLAE